MKKIFLLATILITTLSFSQKKMYGNYDYLGTVDFLGTININGVPLSQVNTASTLVAYNATVSDAYTSAQPNRHITLAGNSDITVTGGVSGDSGLWYLYGTGTATLNNTDASTLVVPVSGNLKVVYFLVDKDDNLTWYQDENSGGSGAVAVQTATGDGTTTINWTVSPFMDFTFGAFNEIITMTPPAYPERLRLKLTQDGVGSRTVTWGNDVYVPSGIMPTLSTGAGDIDVVNLFWNGVDFELDEDFLDYQLVAGVDSEAPTAPTGLASSNVTETTLDLTWTAATDNVAVTNYKVYQDAVEIASLGNVLTYNVTGLTASTAYAFTVTALDIAANESVVSNTVNVTTNASGVTNYAANLIAAGTFTAEEQTLINNFFATLDTDTTIYDQIDAMYMFIGTTAANQNFNAMNPVDTDAAFRLTPLATITRDKEGAIGAMNTFYDFSVNGVTNSVHVSYYSYTSAAVAGNTEMGVLGGGRMLLDIKEGGTGTSNFDCYSFGAGRVSFNTANAFGYFIGNRTGTTFSELVHEGVQVNSIATTSGTPPTGNTYLNAYNATGNTSQASSKKCGFATIGKGLSPSQWALLDSAVQTFVDGKTALP